MLRCLSFSISFLVVLSFSLRVPAQGPAKLVLHLDEPGAAVSPGLYGLMTEEINFSYEGGLYGELIRNRSFKDSSKVAAFWSLAPGTGKATMSLDKQGPVGPALPVSLRVDVVEAGEGVGLANEGYWGMAMRPNTKYSGSFFIRGAGAAAGGSAAAGQALQVALESADGKTVFAAADVAAPGAEWKRVSFSLTTKTGFAATAEARFVIRLKSPGSYWFSLVSLFPPTYKDRANGNRADLMQMLADMKPAFLRLPGGNYLEGNTFSQRWNWKKTIGPLESRAGHLSPWRYRSTDGMGLLEFLEWCEDLNMEPLLAVFAGYTLNRDYLEAGPFLQPFVDDALDEIEYITGAVSTPWGARRAKDGHPQPFPLHYVEIGNEDGFDVSGSYEGRYAQFYDAIKARYPQLHIISTVGGKDGLGGRFPAPAGRTEIVDEHYYRNAGQMEENAGQYDHYDRKGPKIFVGEWATREGEPTTNFNAALGDAAWMTGMERNSDLVILSSYAPLFVNVNPGGMQWKSDLIGYDALSSFGSPSYHAQKMFSTHLGDRIVRLSWENIPTQLQKLGARDSAAGVQPKTIDALFFSATRDAKKGLIYLKVVNTQAVAQALTIDLAGAGKVGKDGVAWTLAATGPAETNSISEPQKIIPVESAVKGMGRNFVRTFPPYSITVLQIKD
ncbi:alpha-L-arabinofuranosidase C-terminal domain-containing protein [Puia sp.]|uniref:alpha-L-arabinofuranosidase C-terminal domain-containing protein n=1 Tax=Puia sp. TaxID=2045100 RepID=UPI002F3E9501